MYSAKVSRDMVVDKNGYATLGDMKISVDGYTNPKMLRKAKDCYNSGKKMPEPPGYEKWPKGTWQEMYYSLMAGTLKWKRRMK
ncbi:MAG: hypothetical protein V1906_02055 [Candidatus Woesearchaeota archaeon]